MKDFRDKIFLLIFILSGILAGVFLIREVKNFGAESDKIFLAQISTPFENKSEPIRLFFVGDIMLDRGVEYMVKKYGNNDWHFPFLRIADNLDEADILFGNLESVISDKGYKIGSIYSFRAEPESIKALKYAGFDVLSVANNHIFDYGRQAMEDEFKRLQEAGIDYVGGGFLKNDACLPVIRTIEITSDRTLFQSVKIGFLGYTNVGSRYWEATEDRSGICWLNEENLETDIKEARKQADLVIVSIHWGDEYQSEPNENQKYFGHLAIDLGADLVIGHHPHIIQPLEDYKNGYIAYSLGNFLFDQGFSQETMTGLLLEVIIQNKKIEKVIPREIKMNEFFQPSF